MKRIIACAGDWLGTSTLYLPGKEPDSSASTLTVTPVLDGRFVRLDYTWAERDILQQGSLLVGVEAACWIDTWHMSDTMMICPIRKTEDAAWSCRGSFAVPPGPDWGWRIDITPALPGKLRIVMTNISPDEEEALAVDAEYSQVAA